MTPPEKPLSDNERMKRTAKESEIQAGKKYSLWEKLARILEGEERRNHSTRKPDHK
jgi:hypothetical protein